MDIVLYGAGGFGREIYDSLPKSNLQSTIETVTFIDDFRGEKNTLMNQSVVTFNELLKDQLLSHRYLITVGTPKARKQLLSKLDVHNLQLTNFIAENSIVSSSAQLSDGVIACSGTIIANNSSVARNVAINVNTIVGHDVTIGENSSISSQVNLGGGSKIGDDCYIGMGALIREGVSIGHNSVIGMGSVVFENIPADVIAVGNPARVVKKNDFGIQFHN